MTWNGFELVCANIDEDSDYDDSRAITEFGFEAPTLRVKKVDKVWAIQKSRGHYIHLKLNGEAIHPVAEKEDGVRYLRVADTLSPADPLMDLPSCETYKLQERVDKTP